ncbi:hypothetical protein L202_05296 [Cryptococcus amylolentus CBS 6039]|uniref:Uncharacterized protein n=2 Tax=Cryptococcus amylolentus TaxID=104669 RepID=A0A1E3HJY3_9TREE|nr:hypothetical protein L202_05296 [Cryptococcus amylolentus CBS 6039]ODN76653.1 hypothetical protein L202_05296 [Cryptococcus amylolentus CBS 6039]ODO04620.1 hypothetical protein I350_05226 [Cryptococcus amylolentus CBS 6273]
MTLTVAAPTHVVAIPAAFWGHLRPMLNLLLNLLKIHPNLHITVFITPSISSHMLVDLYAFQNKTDSGSGRLLVITCGEKPPEDTFVTPDFTEEVDNYAKILPAFVKGVFEGKADLGHGRVNKFAHVVPSKIIFDMCQTFFPAELRKIAKVLHMPIPPLFIFTPFSLASLYQLFLEGGDGRYGRILKAVERDVSAGIDIAEAYTKRPWEFNGSVITPPDLPSKFDYEWWPLMITQDTPAQATMGFIPTHSAFHDRDVVGVVVPFIEELEPKATSTLEERLGKSIYAVGPQLPEEMWNGTVSQVAPDADGQKVIRFLDDLKVKHGSRSVAYVSFGSLFFPFTRPELVTYLLQSLQESSTPFMFAHPSGLRPPPTGLIEPFEGLEDVCLVKFAPQWQVLNHDATAFFVTLLSEVPVVTMPFGGDQPEIASLLTDILHVGIDLEQCKTFNDPAFRTLHDGTEVIGTEKAIKEEMKEAWVRMKASDGSDMRLRVKEVKSRLRDSLANGRAGRDMVKLGRVD